MQIKNIYGWYIIGILTIVFPALVPPSSIKTEYLKSIPSYHHMNALKININKYYIWHMVHTWYCAVKSSLIFTRCVPLMTGIPLLSRWPPHERTQSQINHNEITISRSRRQEDPDKTVSTPCYLRREWYRDFVLLQEKWERNSTFRRFLLY